jgi:uncharacterized oligopeptide transporter (OPT) family protein
MAAVTQAVFNYQLPWTNVFAGVLIVMVFIVMNHFLFKRHLSALAIAIGMYLPLSSSIPLFLGSLMALIAQRNKQQGSVILACGIVAGSALMDVVLAIPFAVSGNPDLLKMVPAQFHGLTITLGCLMVLGLGIWFNRSSFSLREKVPR